MMTKALYFVAVVTFMLTTFAFAKEENLLTDPGFEDAGKWEKVIIGATPEFALDQTVKHGGKQSGRITAAEVTRAYYASAPIAVAPGEKISASGWVKVKDVQSGM